MDTWQAADPAEACLPPTTLPHFFHSSMSDTEMADAPEQQQQQPEISKNRKHRKDKR